MVAEPKMRTVYRVRRWHGTKLEKDYGEFTYDWVAQRVARASAEKHTSDIVIVEPVKKPCP